MAEPAARPRRDPRGANAWVRGRVPWRFIGLADGARLGIVLTTAGDRVGRAVVPAARFGLGDPCECPRVVRTRVGLDVGGVVALRPVRREVCCRLAIGRRVPDLRGVAWAERVGRAARALERDGRVARGRDARVARRDGARDADLRGALRARERAGRPADLVRPDLARACLPRGFPALASMGGNTKSVVSISTANTDRDAIRLNMVRSPTSDLLRSPTISFVNYCHITNNTTNTTKRKEFLHI